MTNILLVEDSLTMRRFIGLAVKGIPGSNVIEADNGIDALRKLSNERIDLILTDINMPLMDGLKLIEHVKTSAEHKEIPVVIVTSLGAELKRKAIALGADAYVQKPLQTQELVDIVSGFISPH
jgi:two-component system chemotaxis response regulator CheY